MATLLNTGEAITSDRVGDVIFKEVELDELVVNVKEIDADVLY